MDVNRVVVVSDTHLSERAPEALANWDAVVRYVAANSPDLVIHLGDLTLDGANEAGDLHHARHQLDRLAVPWRAVPGNHDIGDNPWSGAPAGDGVDALRLHRWLDIIGPDHWSLRVGGWVLIAFNAQLAGSGLAAESAQWAWLEEVVDAHDASRPITLVSHKPLAASEAELACAPPYRYLPSSGRQRLADLMDGWPVRLVLSGHVHQYRSLVRDGVSHVWAPTTWAVLPDDVQPVLGSKTCGVLALDLGGPKGAQVSLVKPEGVAQLTISRDIPNRYEH